MQEISLRKYGFVPVKTSKKEKELELIDDCKSNIYAISSALQNSDATTNKMVVIEIYNVLIFIDRKRSWIILL
jgi:hypothetical protein